MIRSSDSNVPTFPNRRSVQKELSAGTPNWLSASSAIAA
tara:strand:- start:662022 stop:662138 length:117 start_codon:yes stop_codon:yes gene_type:complete